MTRVSVMMPVFNGERYLARALDSLRAQSFADFEIVAVDDGSTDATADILKDFADRDARIRVLRRPRSGLVPSRMAALEAARGELVAVMDADDVSRPERLARQVAFLDAHPEVLVVGADVMLIDPHGRPIGPCGVHTDHESIDSELVRGRGEAIPHPAAMFRREALLAVGGYRSRYENGEDLDVYLRLAERGRVANLPDVLADYRQHPGKTSAREAGALRRSVNRMLREAWERRGYAVPSQDPLPPVAEVIPRHELWRAWARQSIESGSLGTARRYALKLAALRPLSWRSWQLVVRAVFGLRAETVHRALGRSAPIAMRGISRLAPMPSRTGPGPSRAELEPVVVVCAADDRYAMPLAVTLRSAAERLSPTHRLDARVIDGGIRSANRQRILDSLDSKRASVAWIPPRRELLGHARVSGHVSLATYYRLLLAELLPNEVRRVIYLDCDLVVSGDLAKLWALDTGDHVLLAVQDASVPTVSCPRGLRNWLEVGLDPRLPYFNAGVLLVDLARWRAEGVGPELLRFLERHAASVRWWDQDALNGVLARRWGSLDPRWNQLPHVRELDPDEIPYATAVLDALLADPWIVHFASSSKPWHYGCTHPDRQRFFDVLDRTAWSGWRPRRGLRDTPLGRRFGGLVRRVADAARRSR